MNLRLVTLIDKLEHNSASEAELLELEELYNAFEVKTGYTHSLPDRTQYKEMIFERINRGILKHDIDQKKNTFKLWPGIAVTAAAVAAMVFGIWFYIDSPIVNRNSQIVNQNDVKPGSNKATLTLANGKTINLSDAKTGIIIDASSLLYNDGSAVERGDSDAGQDLKAIANLTVATPRGGTYQITLPDGTKVWLNAASSLSYTAPLKGRGGLRKVTLSGEAYFEVFENKDQPFVVNSKNQEITVLGTHFNVSAYDDENRIKTTLLEGAVRIASLGSPQIVNRKSDIVNLLPGEQAILTRTNQVEVQKVDPTEAAAWKNGYFRFNNEKITDVMRQLARWYDIEIKYDGKMTEEGLYGKISRYKNISDVLKMLEKTGLIHFEINGRRVTVLR